jgi:hypothetical protein
MSPSREVLTGALQCALDRPEISARLMIFGGTPESGFVYLQLDKGTVYRFALGAQGNELTAPFISEVMNFDLGNVLFGSDEKYKLLMGWWISGLKSYLMKVKSVGNAAYLPEFAKDYMTNEF